MGGDIGIFGGTFNPIHLGHVRLAEDVREAFSLNRIVFIPTNLPPHKSLGGDVDPIHRLRMVELSIEGNPSFECDDAEIRRGGVSYTVDTIDYVYGAYRFEGRPWFIIGSDLLDEMHSWKDIGTLLTRVRFVVLARSGGASAHGVVPEKVRTLAPPAGDAFNVFCGRTIDVTSSEIRERVSSGRSIRYLVADRVYKYIMDNNLYRRYC